MISKLLETATVALLATQIDARRERTERTINTEKATPSTLFPISPIYDKDCGPQELTGPSWEANSAAYKFKRIWKKIATSTKQVAPI